MLKTPYQLGEDQRDNLLAYIADEPEVNVFITGDVELFGMEDPVRVWALVNDNESWDSLVLSFYNNYVAYSKTPLFDAESVAELIQEAAQNQESFAISGKYSVLEPLAAHFPGLSLSAEKLAVLTHINEENIAPAPEGVEIRKLVESDLKNMISLLGNIDEFKQLYDTSDKRDRAEVRIASDWAHGCMTLGAFYKGELIATVSISAASQEACMIVGVATRQDVRKKGVATALVAELCRIQFAEGKKFITLFYENEEAGSIYHRIGFKETDEYAILR